MCEPVTAPALGAWPTATGSAARHAPALLDWAWRQDADCPRVCLLTGGRRTGKSHLMAWLLAGSDSDPRTIVHATVPAKGQTTATMAWELGRQLGYGPLPPDELVDRVRADPRPVRLLVPDLHQAGRGPADLPAADPRTVYDELLAPLLALTHVRTAIEAGHLPLPNLDDALVLDFGPQPDSPGLHGVPPHRNHATTPPDIPAGRTPVAATASAAGPDTGRTVDWRNLSHDEREEALDRALAAGTAAQLLRDPGFLVHGSAAAITATLADPRIAAPEKLRTVWNRAAPQLSSDGPADAERGALLHLAALGTDRRLSEFLRPLAQANTWTARWNHPGRRTSAMAVLPAAGTPNGRVAAADPIGRIHLLDATGGAVVGRLSIDPKIRPVQLAPAGPACLMALEADGTLHAVPVDGSAMAPAGADFLALHHNATGLARKGDRVAAVSADGDRVVVGDAHGRIHQWSLTDPHTGPRTSHLHRNAVTALACLLLRESGVTLVITGSLDGTVRLWDSASGEAMPAPVERRNCLPTALALADTAAGPVLAVAWADRRLHLWQVFEGRMTAVPLLTEADALALTTNGLLHLGGQHGSTALQLDLDRLWS